ncbi:RND family transporter [Pseudomonas sp. GCM10022188]|uniref:efflux RND transporter permease subunit n=1 Tax=Pseudomonas TaxID=286 RepID=UPI001E5E2403|nr:efflux RND transporter permease subunit [Pseudomonas oryzagri]MCC6074174.1 efflux RND transporter permease subunit [Pseudomonas oryzagri]
MDNNKNAQWVYRCADLLMANRRWLLALFILLTLVFAATATRIKLDPGFYKMIPLQHPYMQTFTEYQKAFPGANRVLVNLRWKGQGDIYNVQFLKALREATDDVFFIPGVDRTRVSSLFTPDTRFIEVTEQGFYGDVVVPAKFGGSEQDLATVRRNVARAGVIGRLVQGDLRGALIRADLQEINPETGAKVDYVEIAKALDAVRAKYASAQIEVDIIGFPVLIGDVVSGLSGVFVFFLLAFAITTVLLFAYCRSLRMTLLALVVALLPVVWLLGLLPLLGYGIDPMSILVPFLIFSIGVSHAVQMTNAWKLEVLAGASSLAAAHSSFRRIFVPGALALLANALGFAVIMRIQIDSVRELGITACLGVLLMIITNKMMLPILLSGMRLEDSARRTATAGGKRHPFWWKLSAVTNPATALLVAVACLGLLGLGIAESRKLVIGDIGSGAPEFREDSRYNRDNASIVGSYAIGVDVLSVVVEAKGFEGDACLHYSVMNAVDRFATFMRGVHGVQSVVSVPDMAKVGISANNEGNPRWAALPRSSQALQQGAEAYNPDLGMNTQGCTAMQVLIYTKDHEGATLHHLTSEIKRFITEQPTSDAQFRVADAFRLAGGNAGVMAATNEAVEQAEVEMLVAIFGAITLMCFLMFRSWKAVLCIIAPLAVVSVLCNALMAALGIGLKVATLPVVALGVGVGVDYGIYLFERVKHQIEEEGQDLRMAFYEAMRQRGTAAIFTAVTMSVGVATWAFSPLKFQADMGILLAFMFLVNVFGAVLLLPALACWLNVGGERHSVRADATLSPATP